MGTWKITSGKYIRCWTMNETMFIVLSYHISIDLTACDKSEVYSLGRLAMFLGTQYHL